MLRFDTPGDARAGTWGRGTPKFLSRSGTGDCLVVEPGEDHTFVSSLDDYLVFVVQTPFVGGDKIELDPPEA